MSDNTELHRMVGEVQGDVKAILRAQDRQDERIAELTARQLAQADQLAKHDRAFARQKGYLAGVTGIAGLLIAFKDWWMS